MSPRITTITTSKLEKQLCVSWTQVPVKGYTENIKDLGNDVATVA
jgi:hypothetical protein